MRSIRTACERGEYGSADWADPEIAFVIVDGPTPGTWQGMAAMAEAMLGFLNAWKGLRSEADEYRELDHERILGARPRAAIALSGSQWRTRLDTVVPAPAGTRSAS